MCSRVFVSARCGAALRACVLRSVSTSLLRTGDAECTITEESTSFKSCAPHTPGWSVGVDGGQRRERSTRLRYRLVDQVNTCVTRCVLLCGTALVPRCVHVSLSARCGAALRACVLRALCAPLSTDGLTGVIMHSPDRFFRRPRSSMPEATPLTSHASTF